MVKEKELSIKKYQHVLNVWKILEMKTMKYHHNLHLKCDVLLLAHVSEKLRNRCLENYGLSYLSTTVLSWNAMLSMTKVNLDLTSDIYM